MSVTLSESYTVVVTAENTVHITVFDTVAISESTDLFYPLLLASVSDTVSIAEAVSLYMGLSISEFESVSLAEDLTASVLIEISEVDSVGLVESVTAAMADPLSASTHDSISVDELTVEKFLYFLTDRHRFNLNLISQHITLKFQHDTLDQIMYLEDLGIGIGVFPQVWQNKYNLNLTGNHISLKFQHDTLDEIVYLEDVGFKVFAHGQR